MLLTLHESYRNFVPSFPIVNISSGSAHEFILTCNRDVSRDERTQSILIKYAESFAVYVGTLSVSLDGDLVQFLIRQVQVLGPNHTQTRPNPIHGYAQCVHSTSKPCILKRQFHRIAVLHSPVLMFTYSTSALNITKCSTEPDVNSFRHSHIINA
jgi:hypothetical protein